MANPAEIAHSYMLTGFIFNVLLLGIMITQVYIYYTTYKRDKVWMKFFVGYLFVADIVNTAFCYADLYKTLILRFGDVEKLFTADWVFATEAATTAIIGASVQLFFAWRTHMLTRRWKYISRVIVSLIVLTALTSGVAGIMTAWNVSRYPNFSEFQKFRYTVSTWLGAAAVCDAMITATLVIALRKQKTGFKRTDLIVDRIIKLTMNTGSLTMVVAVLDLIFFLQSTSGLHLLFNYPLSKLYTNSLMSTLNSRRTLVNGSVVETDEDGNSHSTASKIGGTGFTSTFRRDNDIVNLNRPPRAEVFIQVEEHELSDAKVDNMNEVDERSSSTKPYSV
ncbi:hypothetical protein BKA70DRAFT_1553972 [Coprinopsis sp. MPI-PUGE-AT-0042]|nr:hypothetical protein BKA70DRAFT_1553972 [Coprinopsis sp. MPI-PUGE-AT-0042]